MSATSACGKVQNSKWSWAVRALLEPFEDLLERLRPVDVAQPEGGHAAQRDRGDHPERAERRPRGAQELALVDHAHAAVGQDELDRDDLPGEVRQLRAGPVRAGGERSGQRLDVDVAEVRHRQPAGVQLARERLETDAGLDADERSVGVQDAVKRVELQQRPVGDHARAQRMPGTRDADRARAADDRPREFRPSPRRRDGSPEQRAGSRTN